MTNTTKQNKFSKLTNKEKLSRLAMLVYKKEKVIVWEKGKKSCFTFIPTSLDGYSVRLVAEKPYKKIHTDCLYSFQINGANFFGCAKFTDIDGEFTIECSGDLYKLERRKNLRLLSFPHHKLYIFIKSKFFETGDNIVDIKLGRSLYDIFNEFLEESGKDYKKGYIENHLPFRVMDFSIGGVSIHIGELEKELFEEGLELGQVFLNFDGRKIVVPNAKVVYLKKTKSHSRKFNVIKVGIQFLEVDKKLEFVLGGLLFEAIKDVTNDFEDFILE